MLLAVAAAFPWTISSLGNIHHGEESRQGHGDVSQACESAWVACWIMWISSFRLRDLTAWSDDKFRVADNTSGILESSAQQGYGWW